MGTGSARLFLIDSMGYIFRAYHQPQTQKFYTRAGIPTGAVFVFNSMLRKLLTDRRPEYLAAVFDAAAPTFRDELFAEYKANRAEMPSELARQIPYIRRLLEGQRIPILEYPGFEADDVIGALAVQGARAGLEVTIVSSDKDMLQLVTRGSGRSGEGDISVLVPTKDDLVCDVTKVEELMGVPPERVADVMALRGDAIDNIPGAPGIGEKGSRDLIQRFGSAEAAIEHAAEVERKTYRDSLQNNRDLILLSKKLATIETAVPVTLDVAAIAAQAPDRAVLQQLYTELEFHSLAEELSPAPDTGSRDYRELGSEAEVADFLRSLPGDAALAMAGGHVGALLAAPLPSANGPAKGAASSAPTSGQLQFGAEAEAEAVAAAALAISPAAGTARVVPGRLLPSAREWLESSERTKAVADGKAALRALRASGIELGGVRHDVMLYSHLLDPTQSSHALEEVASRRFNARLGAGCAERADAVGQLARLLAPEVERAGLARAYDEIELPLEPVLADMEETGVRVDCDVLARLSGQLGRQIEELRAEIHRLCGGEFNINSPQQLSKVLFEQLKLPAPTKHRKGKVYSTAADELRKLADKHEVAGRVLEYRELVKLKGTYIDTLPKLVNPRTGRVHTTFDQAGTTTGRLASRDPNLQNIPIRTELGRQIRAAFVPEEGWRILSADYSQIELRLLAHFSRDKVLLEAFRKNEDIHCRTAELVFGVPPLMQTHEHRRRAKAVNYGIVYGLSPFGLAQQLGIDQAEAKQFIDDYFATYAGVRKYIDRCLEEVRHTGLVRTLFGRLRPIPEINSRNPQQRGAAEREAINMPLQGTAADLVKLAMIRIAAGLRRQGLRTRMLLQVHDELLFEAPPEELAAARALIRQGMEQAHRLDVPLVAEVCAGNNWRDAK
jgi:DNA polymerase-1